MKNALILSIIAAMLATAFVAMPTFAAEPAYAFVAGPAIDPNLEIGTSFSNWIYVYQAKGLFAFDLRLSYASEILHVDGFEVFPPLNVTEWIAIVTPFEILLSYSDKVPGGKGLLTDDAVPIARIDYTVVGLGVSDQVFQMKLVDVSAKTMTTILVPSGSFSNIWDQEAPPAEEDIYVGFTGAFIGDRHFVVSKDGTIQTLTCQLENMGTVPTRAIARFRLLDSLAGFVGDFSAGTQINPGEVKRVSIDLDATALNMPASYIVEVHVEYAGITDLIIGRHGDRTAAKIIKPLFFTLEE